ncbi:MAG: hypothetical protein C4570_02045 [Ammonifex sp.]|nr:MAG: hypothetical protein C4570_02045 [Ammonifex sp.]
MKQSPPRVKVCIPYYESLPEPAVMLNEHLIRSGIPGYLVILSKRQTAIITFSRNELADANDGFDYDYIFFVDSDVGYSEEEMNRPVQLNFDGRKIVVAKIIAQMKQILDHGLNICGGFYCSRKAPYAPMVFKKNPADPMGYVSIADFPDSGVHEIDAIGTGFLCIKRPVIEAFHSRARERLAMAENARKAVQLIGEALEGQPEKKQHLSRIAEYIETANPGAYPPFWLDAFYQPEKRAWRNVGEDIYFCREAQKMGYKLYCDFQIQLGHMTTRFIKPEIYKGTHQAAFVEVLKKAQMAEEAFKIAAGDSK